MGEDSDETTGIILAWILYTYKVIILAHFPQCVKEISNA